MFPGENLPGNICRMKNIYRKKSICRTKRFSKVSNLLSQAQPGAGPSSSGSSWSSLRSLYKRTALRALYLLAINIVVKGHPARRPDEHGRDLVDWEGDGVQADRARGGKDGLVTKAEQAITFHTLIFLISCSKSASYSFLWC